MESYNNNCTFLTINVSFVTSTRDEKYNDLQRNVKNSLQNKRQSIALLYNWDASQLCVKKIMAAVDRCSDNNGGSTCQYR